MIAQQKTYRDLINTFIETMVFDKDFFMSILTNNKKAPVVRTLEKTLRKTHNLGSAYGQNAVDYAVKELHNHFVRIKNKLYGFVVNHQPELLPYFNSNALLNAAVMNFDEIEVLESLIEIEKTKEKPRQSTLDFYEKLQSDLCVVSANTRQFNRSEVRDLFYERLEAAKVPFVKRTPIQLDARVCKLEKAEHIEAHYVISIKMMGCTEYVHFPLKTSSNSLRRMSQYKTGSPTICFMDGKVKVSVPFEKKITKMDSSSIIAADAGITDLLAASNGKTYGSFSGMSKLYEGTVEKKTRQRSKIRS